MYSKINFVKINPTENMTILVKDKIPQSQQKEVANKLLNYNNVHAEQVGFIEKSQNPLAHSRLQMMGGEFCGNALLSLACLIARDEKYPVGGAFQIQLECSGSSEILTCWGEILDEGIKGKIKIPSPVKIDDKTINIRGKDYNFGMVHMPGILHMLINMDNLPAGKTSFAFLSSFTEMVLDEIDAFVQEDALGIIFYDRKILRIEPFVYVRSTNTKIWERGCGSGTAAIGAYFSDKSGENVKFDVLQPGGIITVYVENNNGKLENIFIESVIKIVAEGVAYI